MKNRYKPFFYDEKRIPFSKIILIFLLTTFALIFFGYQVPGIRQIISEPLFAAGSFAWNGIKAFVTMTRMYQEEEKPRQTYTPVELPDKDVLFAESLENLSAITQADPLADLRRTPTPSEYDRVANWEYLDPNLNYAISSGAKPIEEDADIRLIPPVFERADLHNDGAAILSALMRYWGIVENQYHIADQIHPDTLDPFISFSDLESYISENYSDFMTLIRDNGDRDLLLELLHRNIPIIIFVQRQTPLPFWPGDDHISGSYLLILGYNAQTKSFLFQDTRKGNTLEITEEELLSCWYPFQRSYMIVYPEEKDEDVREALTENYFEELNIQRALAKFKTDSEMIPDNAYAQYNLGTALHKYGDEKGAWDSFQTALDNSLPQRFINYRSEMLETALILGYADDIITLTENQYKRNSHDEILTLYRGWAAILQGDAEKGGSLFNKAGKINPNSELVLYAIKYKETMIN